MLVWRRLTSASPPDERRLCPSSAGHYGDVLRRITLLLHAANVSETLSLPSSEDRRRPFLDGVTWWLS